MGWNERSTTSRTAGQTRRHGCKPVAASLAAWPVCPALRLGYNPVTVARCQAGPRRERYERTPLKRTPTTRATVTAPQPTKEPKP